MELGDLFVAAIAIVCLIVIACIFKANKEAYDEGYSCGYKDCLDRYSFDGDLSYSQGYQDGYEDALKKVA